MFETLKVKRDIFWANFRWDSYELFLNGRFASVSSSVPIFAYLIIFNDYLLQSSGFAELTSDFRSTFFLSDTARLRLVYFGLVLIGLINIFFRIRKPWAVKQASSLPSYILFAKQNFTFRDFRSIHDRIGTEGHSSPYGRYYTDDWEAFAEDANWSESGQAKVYVPKQVKQQSRKNVNFAAALERHEDLIRGILIDNYIYFATRRKFELLFIVSLCGLGYFLLFIPSLDLFLRVAQLSFFSGVQ